MGIAPSTVKAAPPLTRQGKAGGSGKALASGSSEASLAAPLGAPPLGKGCSLAIGQRLGDRRTPLGVLPVSGIIPAAAAGTAGWNRRKHRGLDARVLATVMRLLSTTGDAIRGSFRPRDNTARVQICHPTATRRSGRRRAARLAQSAPDQRQGSAKVYASGNRRSDHAGRATGRGTASDLYGPAFFSGAAALAAHSSQMVVAANHDGWEPGDAQGSLN